MSTESTRVKRQKMDNGSSKQKPSYGKKDRTAGKWRVQKAIAQGKANISASGIHNGDVGIFVSCDKGQEKRSLHELHDLVSELLSVEKSMEQGDSPPGDADVDIEADITAELESLRKESKGLASSSISRISLVTLDIPCVSFLRLPMDQDPVALVYKICKEAYDKPDRPRSRYIKRLTPLTRVRKVLNDGIQALCNDVLPRHFGDEVKRFAIRPTIRNNDKIKRDDLITLVADKVTELGQHTVDLKGYEKLILVDVYRNVCGMSVVDTDFEKFKRFNLAEIYAAGRENQDKDSNAQ